jgi:hypothetical protein
MTFVISILVDAYAKVKTFLRKISINFSTANSPCKAPKNTRNNRRISGGY